MKHFFIIWLKLFLIFSIASCSDYKNQDVPSGTNQISNTSQKKSLPKDLEAPNTGEFSIQKMLVNVGLNVVSKNTDLFMYQSGLLKDKLNTYCGNLKKDESTSDQEVKEQWKSAMLAFHRVASLPIGLLSESNSKLEKDIYSWPVVSECGIDQQVIKNENIDLSSVLQNRKSLSAIEYLLFEKTLVSKCAPFVEPKAKEWSQKPEIEKKIDRCNYALKVAIDVHEKAKLLSRNWDKDITNSTVDLIDGSKYSNLDQAVNAYTDALFAFETFRDEDLAIPMGIHADCKNPKGKCLEFIEHPWSEISLQAMDMKIRTFQEALYASNDPNAKSFGLDDYLKSKSHADVVEAFQISINNALSALGDIKVSGQPLNSLIEAVDTNSCKEAIKNDTISSDPVCKFYQHVRKGTTTLKIDVLTLLSLSAPTSHAGDND
jgi:hypothetical protein